jgi:hypothetical protein
MKKRENLERIFPKIIIDYQSIKNKLNYEKHIFFGKILPERRIKGLCKSRV